MKIFRFVWEILFLLISCHQNAAFLAAPQQTTKQPTFGIPTIMFSTRTTVANQNVEKKTPIAGKRVNVKVRNLMGIIEDRYGRDTDWTKTRRYLYQASDKLTSEQVADVVAFLDSITTGKMAIHVLQKVPRILKKPVQTFLKPTSDFLVELWGEDLFDEAILRNPGLLLSSGVGYTTNRRKSKKNCKKQEGSVEEMLSIEVGLSAKAIAKLKRSNPNIFGLAVTQVEAIVDYFSHILEDGAIDQIQIKKAVGKLVSNYPFLLNLSVEANLKPRVEFLSSRCGLNETDVAKLLRLSGGGSVLGLSVEQNLKPKIDVLVDLLQNDQIALKRCILSHPQILALSLSNLKSKTDYFDSIGDSLANRVLHRCPAIFSLSLETNLIPTIEFLSSIWNVSSVSDTLPERKISATNCTKNANSTATLSGMLQEYPNILTLSLFGNIQATMDFYNRTGYTLLSEDWKLEDGHNRIRGRYIAASLYNRLLPRWQYCLSSDRKAPSLHLLAGSSDTKFCKDLGIDLEEFTTFRLDAAPKLKFSSQFDTWLKTGKPIDV